MEILQSQVFMYYYLGTVLVYPFIGDRSLNFACRFIKGLFISPIAVPFILLIRKFSK